MKGTWTGRRRQRRPFPERISAASEHPRREMIPRNLMTFSRHEVFTFSIPRRETFPEKYGLGPLSDPTRNCRATAIRGSDCENEISIAQYIRDGAEEKKDWKRMR